MWEYRKEIVESKDIEPKDIVTEQALTIPVVSCSYWFMEKLGYAQGEKIRVKYRLKEPTLKITDEMLKEIYEYDDLFESSKLDFYKNKHL